MSFFYSLRHRIALLVVLMALSLMGMGLSSLSIESITTQSVSTPSLPLDAPAPINVLQAPYLNDQNIEQKITVDLLYRGYGNTTISLTPNPKFSEAFFLNGQKHLFESVVETNAQSNCCKERVIDLSPWLREGHNELVVFIFKHAPKDAFPIISLSIGSVLLGQNALSSSFTLLFLGSSFSLVYLLLRRLCIDKIACGLFLASCFFHLLMLKHVAPFDISLDLEKHLSYLNTVINHSNELFTYRGILHWHPPTYYLLVAALAKLVGYIKAFNVWTAIYSLSFLCYSIFLFYGMRSFSLFLRGGIYYLCLCLLFFWPSGMFSSSWSFNDILYYPFYAACFYYTLLWHREEKPTQFFCATFAGALAFIVKSSGAIPLGVLAIVALYKFSSGRIRFAYARNMYVIAGIGSLLAAAACNNWRSIYSLLVLHKKPDYVYVPCGTYQMQIRKFLPLDLWDLITHPTFKDWKDISLINLQSRTLLFSIVQNDQLTALAAFIAALWLVIAAYIIIFLLNMPRGKLVSNLPILAGLFLPLFFSYGYALACGSGSCVDFRYIQPALVSVILVFAFAVQSARPSYPVFYYWGYGFAFCFAMLSLVYALLY